MACEDDESSMEVQVPLSPPASPDNVLLYDPMEQWYYEVPACDVRQCEVEVFATLPGEVLISDEEDEVVVISDEEEGEIIVISDEEENVVRRRLF